MNVLILTSSGGFVPQFEMNNVRLLQSMGATVHYATNSKKPAYRMDLDELKAAGIIFHEVGIDKSPLHIKNNHKAYKALIRIIEDNKIELIHCHNPVGGVLGRLLGRHFRRSGVSVIYTAHGFHFYKGGNFLNWFPYYFVEKRMAACTDTLVTINEEDYKRACGFKLRRNGRVYKIPSVGINMDRLTNLSAINLREKYGISDKGFLLTTVGEVCGNKNHITVINAIKQLKYLHQEKIYYIICGDGPDKNKLMQYVKKCGLEDRIIFAGYDHNIFPYITQADAFVFPSVREGLGMSALEALAAGAVVIAADNRGTREYMQDGINGYVYGNSRDEKALVQCILSVLTKERKEISRISENARSTAEKFGKDKVEIVMKEVYNRFLNN